MLRRTFIRLMAGTVALVGSAAGLRSAFAATLGSVSTIDKAIASKNADTVARFILDYRSTAAKASVKNKIAMLSTMKISSKGDPYASTALKVGQYEKAVLTVLIDAEKDPAKLKRIADAVGRDWIKAHASKFQSADLRRIASKALK